MNHHVVLFISVFFSFIFQSMAVETTSEVVKKDGVLVVGIGGANYSADKIEFLKPFTEEKLPKEISDKASVIFSWLSAVPSPNLMIHSLLHFL